MAAITQLLFLVVLAATSRADSNTIDIDVLTLADTPVTTRRSNEQYPGFRVRVYEVDAIQHLETALTDKLPSDARGAKHAVLTRLNLLSKGHRDSIEESAEALVLIAELQIEKLPAIVFDRQWVVYGVTDLATALALFDAAKRSAR